MKFALVGANGQRISDTEGNAIAASCRAVFSTDGANSNPANPGNCFRYDTNDDQFVLNAGTKDLAIGPHTFTGTVVAPDATVVATHSIVTTLR